MNERRFRLPRGVPSAPGVLLALLAAALMVGVHPATAQVSRVGDLARLEHDHARRLMGYGLVTGLSGSGDRSLGGRRGAPHTVRSVVNLLGRFGVDIPADEIRLRNVAAVLVTAEVSPFARPGARFDVQVSSIGDARSLEGGVLWMTPLLPGPDHEPWASAEGPVEIRREEDDRWLRRRGSGVVTAGGILETALPTPAMSDEVRLLLRLPDLATAARITGAINAEIGQGTARLLDPGAIALSASAADQARVLDLEVEAVHQTGRIVIDERTGVVVAGGALSVGPASVRHGDLTLVVGDGPTDGDAPVMGQASVPIGSPIGDVVAALHTAGARPGEIADVLLALKRAGALHAELEVR